MVNWLAVTLYVGIRGKKPKYLFGRKKICHPSRLYPPLTGAWYSISSMEAAMSEPCRTEHCISGIHCEVQSCEYHGEHCECMASGIEVCSCDPIQQCEVQCKTFRPKTGR